MNNSETFTPDWTSTKCQSRQSKITQRSVLVCAYGIDPLTWSEVGEGEKEAEKFDSLRYREKQLISAPKRGKAVMFCMMG